jgi:hypothetical protein
MIINLVHSKIIDNNEIYFYVSMSDDFKTETKGVYLINGDKWYLCENVENFDNFIKNDFRIFFETKDRWILSVILICNKESIKLKEFYTYDFDKVKIKNELESVINFTNANKKRKIENVAKTQEIKVVQKITQHNYCERCDEDSMRFSCDDPKCHNNKKVRIIEENKSKSYCDRCDEDSMRWACDDRNCRNYSG